MKRMSLLPLIGFLFTGCARFFIEDPSDDGLVSPQPGLEWMPPDGYIHLCIPLENPDVDFNAAKKMALGDLINVALKNNPLTKSTWAQARAAAFNLGAAKSLYYPTVSLDESYEWVNSNFVPKAIGSSASANSSAGTAASADVITATGGGTGIAGNGSTFGTNSFQELQSDLLVSYLLLDFGGRSATVEAARQALYASDWSYNLSIQTVILNVLQAYYTYLENKANVKATELNLKDVQINLEAAQSRFSAGLATKVDVLQAQANLINVEYNLENFKGQVNIALGQLATALGLPANTPLDVNDIPEIIPVQTIEGDLDKLMEMAKIHRPDLSQSQAQFLQAQANVIVAKSAGAPTVTGSINLLRGDYFKSTLLRSHVYTSMIEVNIPIFQGFYYEYSVRQAQANVDNAFALWQEQETIVLNNVLSSYYTHKIAEEQLKFSEEYLKFAQEAYNAVLEGYRLGANTFLDVLAGQTTLANARSQLITTRVTWAESISSLAYAVGILGVTTEQVNQVSLAPEFTEIKDTTPVPQLEKFTDY